MEIILSQRFHYAVITPYKDYCRLIDQNKLRFEHKREELLLFGGRHSLPPKSKKNVFFFTDENSNSQYDFNKRNYLFFETPLKDQFYTIKDSQIKRHFGRPFSEIYISTIERSIVKMGDKITIKIYVGTKYRKFNSRYFRKSYFVYSLTINLKNGNFTTSSINKNGKTLGKNFRINNFQKIDNETFHKFYHNPPSSNTENCKKIMKMYDKELDNYIFTKEILKIFESNLEPNVAIKNNKRSLIDDFYRFFVNKKQIKIPNAGWMFWLSRYYPTEKFLKKNDRKLVASILDMLGIKSKITIKILHDNPNIDLFSLHRICKLFGEDYQKYIGNINKSILENSSVDSELIKDSSYGKSNILYGINKVYDLREEEKINLLKIINSTKFGQRTFFSNDLINTLFDHFDMIDKIRKYDHDCELKSKNFQEFNSEHQELAKLVSAIKKGWIIEYKFNEKMVSDVETPIPLKVNFGTEQNPLYKEDTDIVYYPVVLKREDQYEEEGKFMHHCVATYVDRDKSIIISVRTQDGSDRVTCEFNCQDGKLIQARHFCNRQPPEDILYIIQNYLCKKVSKYARLGLLHSSEKINVPLVINGVEIKREEPTRYQDNFEEFYL